VAERIVCVPVDGRGHVDGRWGRAAVVAVAHVSEGAVTDWVEHRVDWDARHDTEGEGRHHAEIARFLQQWGVTDVVAHHMGPPMAHMIDRMGIQVHLGASGDAREAVRRLAL
jgi:predicted Fe-Mo cluster-binding NifX family protein